MPGLTFKPESDDMRNAPSLAVIPNLLGKGAKVHAYDPKDVEETIKLQPEKIDYCDDIYETVDGEDVIVLMYGMECLPRG